MATKSQRKEDLKSKTGASSGSFPLAEEVRTQARPVRRISAREGLMYHRGS